MVEEYGMMPTILKQHGQALLDEQGSIEDDQAEADRQDIVAGAHLEEGADGFLGSRRGQSVKCLGDISDTSTIS